MAKLKPPTASTLAEYPDIARDNDIRSFQRILQDVEPTDRFTITGTQLRTFAAAALRLAGMNPKCVS